MALPPSPAERVAREQNADVLEVYGQIDRKAWVTMSAQIAARKRLRPNVLVMLITPGGDADAAYHMGRCLQYRYDLNVASFIPGICKSAGTLLTLASQKMFIADSGELGPLDIQIAKADELFEMSSGLSVQTALTTLQEMAAKMFVNLLLTIRGDTKQGLTTKTTAELAASIVGTLLEPIYRQIEPVKIGENQRAMSITKQYGARLIRKSGALRSDRMLDLLISAYPDHGFVIDREEAATLFKNVEAPTPAMARLGEQWHARAVQVGTRMYQSAEVKFLSDELQPDVRKAPRKGTANERKRKASAPRNGRTPVRRRPLALGSGASTTSNRRPGNGHAPGANGKG